MKHIKTVIFLYGAYTAYRLLQFPKAVGKGYAGPSNKPGLHIVAESETEHIRDAPFCMCEVGDRPVLKAIFAYDNSSHKNLVHVRLGKHTVDRLNHFKLAAKVDMAKLVAFAVDHLFETQPELNAVIRNFIQQTQL